MLPSLLLEACASRQARIVRDRGPGPGVGRRRCTARGCSSGDSAGVPLRARAVRLHTTAPSRPPLFPPLRSARVRSDTPIAPRCSCQRCAFRICLTDFPSCSLLLAQTARPFPRLAFHHRSAPRPPRIRIQYRAAMDDIVKRGYLYQQSQLARTHAREERPGKPCASEAELTATRSGSGSVLLLLRCPHRSHLDQLLP